MKSGRNPPHLDGLFSRVSKRHAKCTECGELIVRNQLLRHTQTKHPRLFDEPVGKKGASSPLRQRNNGLAESCCNGASMSIGNGKRSMGHANRNNNNTNSNASPNKYKICLRPRSTSKSLSEVTFSGRSSTITTRSSDGTVADRNEASFATRSAATVNRHLKAFHGDIDEKSLLVIVDSPSLVLTPMLDHSTSSPSCSSTSTATTLQTESTSVRSDDMTATNGGVTNGTAVTNGVTKVKRARKQRTADNKITYVDPTSRMKFEDLFYDILPYVSATYTPLMNPPMPNLIGVDTNQGWLRNLNTTRLHDFLDLSAKEKEFFALWNAFVSRRVNRAVGRKGLSSLLSRFLEAHQSDVLNRNLAFNFICHCAHLRRCGYLSSTEFFDLWMRFDGCGVDFSERVAQFSSSSSNGVTANSSCTSVRRQSPRKPPTAQLLTSPHKNYVSPQKMMRMDVDEQLLLPDHGKNGDIPMEAVVPADPVTCNGNGVKRRAKNSHILMGAVTNKRSPLKTNGGNSDVFGAGSGGGRATRASPLKQL